MQNKNDSFAKEMARIAKQADAEQIAEIKAARRRAIFSKIRKVAVVLVLVGVGVFGYVERAELGQRWNQVMHKTGLTGGGGLTGYKESGEKLEGKVNDLQAAAAKRNQLLDEITAQAAGKK